MGQNQTTGQLSCELSDDKARKMRRVSMSHQSPADRIHNFDEVMRGYTKEEAIQEASRCLKCKKMACSEQCPIHQDIQGYVRAIAEDDFDKSLAIILDKNPFPASMGRVCPQTCTTKCALGKKGEAIAIAALKRAASDYGTAKVEAGALTGKRIAIVGAGPAGLSAGFFLAKTGHRVTVLEKEQVLGGMLSTAIPAYRLPRDQIKKDIARIESVGLEIKTGVSVGADIALEELSKKFDAVLITVGTYKPIFMKIPGEDKRGVVHVIDFLKEFHLGRSPWVGDRVAVIGGGSSAMDAVRTVKRLGKEAWLVYRRAREQMPAQIEEVQEGEEEAITFHYLTNPTNILGDGKVAAMECVKMALGEPDASGRPRPVPVPGSQFSITVDMVVEALSQEPELDSLLDRSQSYRISKWNSLEVDGNGMTSVAGVFAGGDVVNGASTVVQALASAYRAVDGINAYLRGK
jgi:glutamate synthase (NADPH/NADH) small chain